MSAEAFLKQAAENFLRNFTEIYCLAKCPEVPDLGGSGAVWAFGALCLLQLLWATAIVVYRGLHVREQLPSLPLLQKLLIIFQFRSFPTPNPVPAIIPLTSPTSPSTPSPSPKSCPSVSLSPIPAGVGK